MADDIRIFLPGIGNVEHSLRANLRTFRNCASAMIARTDSDTARGIAWECCNYANAFIYAGASEATLRDIGQFCNRLMITAMQAERIDDERGHDEN